MEHMHARTLAAAWLVALALPTSASAATRDGLADTTFGDSGFAFTVPDGLEGPAYGQIIQQADGKVVGAVSAYPGSDVEVTRHTTAGQPDAGFGTDGVADVDLPQGQSGTAV